MSKDREIRFLSGTEECALTIEEERQLDENYNDLYRAMLDLRSGLNEFRNDRVIYTLKHACGSFREITETIVGAYAGGNRSYCQGKNTYETIRKLFKHGYIEKDVEDLLDRMRFYSNPGSHKDWTREKQLSNDDFPAIRDLYDDLCRYIRTFLIAFPEPGQVSKEYRRKFNQIREHDLYEQERGQQNNNSNYTQEKGSEGQYTDSSASGSNEYERYIIPCLVILAVLLIILISSVGSCSNRSSGLSPSETAEEAAEIETEGSEKVQENTGINKAGEDQEEPIIEQEEGSKEEAGNEEKHYAIGETWTVDGKWEFTVDGITATPFPYDINNPYNPWGEHDPDDESQMIIISYHYTNLGAESISEDGLSISISDSQIVDGNGVYAERMVFVNDDLTEPAAIAVGGTWEAQQDFHILTDADTATLYFKCPGYDDTAIFDLSW